MRKFILFLLWVSGSMLYAQEAMHLASTIPSDLKENAEAVVRLDQTKVHIISKKKLKLETRRVVTVLEKNGFRAVKNYVGYNPSTKIKSIEVRIYNEGAKEIEKFKKNDFSDVSAVSNGTLYSESRIKYFGFTPTSYPYTVDMKVTIETDNTAFLPDWTPLADYKVSTEKSVFEVNNPEAAVLKLKENNFKGFDIEKTASPTLLKYQLSSIAAMRHESLSPAFYKVEPTLILSLENFYLEGYNGNASDWKKLGKWQYDELVSGRDELPEATINNIKTLIAQCKTKREKIKKIYNYVQDNTRYISVQLGIGGWQPITAEEVDRVKYGDCKGLTNYTKALLKSQGIESYYTVVWAGSTKRNLEADFASMEGNHVILNVPDEENDIWLECTSQDIPFGFIGDFTDDRDVLVVTPEGGKIKHTTAYTNEINKKVTEASYILNEAGDLVAKFVSKNYGSQYNDRYRFVRLSDKEKKELYQEYWDYLNGAVISDVKITNNKDQVELVEEVSLNVKGYANKMGDGLLVQLNAFNVNNNVPDRYRNRKQSFEIQRGYLDEDQYTIKLPSGYVPEVLPEPLKIDNKFGSYEVQVRLASDNSLVFERRLLLKKGVYPKEDYSDYRSFRRTIAKGDNRKIIIKKI